MVMNAQPSILSFAAAQNYHLPREEGNPHPRNLIIGAAADGFFFALRFACVRGREGGIFFVFLPRHCSEFSPLLSCRPQNEGRLRN